MKLPDFTLFIVLCWLTGWWFIPRSYGWLDLSSLRWVAWNTGVYVSLFYIVLDRLVGPKELTRFQRWGYVYLACIGGVNSIREAFGGGANDSWELILGIPFGLVFILLVSYRLFRKPKKSIWESLLD